MTVITTNTVYASGNWVAAQGHEDEFVQRWMEFLRWTRASFAQLGSAQLLRDDENPQHFISFATWTNVEALRDWRSRLEFADRLAACRALCDDFRGSSYTVAAEV